MTEKHLIGRIYYTEQKRSKFKPLGLDMITRNDMGQDWMLDINNLTPNELRILADFLEDRENNS